MHFSQKWGQTLPQAHCELRTKSYNHSFIYANKHDSAIKMTSPCVMIVQEQDRLKKIGTQFNKYTVIGIFW